MSRRFHFDAMIALAFLLTGHHAMGMTAAGPLLRFGAGMDAARVSVDSKIPAELDKTGSQVGVGALAAIDSRWLSWTLGASYCTSQVKGSDDVRGVEQEVAVTSLAFHSGLFFNLSRGFGLGLKARMQKGPAADFGVYPDKEAQTFRESGPAMRAMLARVGGYDLIAEAAWLRSRGIEKRDVQTVIAGFTAALPVTIRNPLRGTSRVYQAVANPPVQGYLPNKVDVPANGWDVDGDGYPDLVHVGRVASDEGAIQEPVTAYDFDADGKPDFFRNGDTNP